MIDCVRPSSSWGLDLWPILGYWSLATLRHRRIFVARATLILGHWQITDGLVSASFLADFFIRDSARMSSSHDEKLPPVKASIFGPSFVEREDFFDPVFRGQLECMNHNEKLPSVKGSIFRPSFVDREDLRLD